MAQSNGTGHTPVPECNLGCQAWWKCLSVVQLSSLLPMARVEDLLALGRLKDDMSAM